MTYRPLFSVVCALLACAVAAQADELKPLALKFPPPLVTGTPVPVKLPHLETPNTPSPEILVPPDVTNLARGKTVTASDTAPVIGEPALITDGDKQADEGCFVEFDKGRQWIQIDLGAPAELHAVAVWHYHSQARAYHDVIVQLSDDPDFKPGSTITTIFNNDHDNTSGLGEGKDPAYIETNKGRLISARKTVARYVRLTSAGNTTDALNHYNEVEVYGRTK